MTTVAYRDGLIAGDSLVSMGSHIATKRFCKIIKTETHLAGFSGDAQYASSFLEWVRGGCNERRIPKGDTGEIDAFTVDREGMIVSYGDKMTPMRMGRLPFYAIGSGWAYALGAMEMGATADQAVKIAAKHDTATGGRVRKLLW